MHQVLKTFARLFTSCATLPLVGALAFLGVVRLEAALGPAPQPVAKVVSERLPEDFEIIDRVLARRAPGLGLTMRRQLGVAIAEEAAQAGFDPLLVLAIIDVESDFDEEAISSKGAKGLMQIKPTTLHFQARKEGLRLSREEVTSDPALCVRLGIRYLRELNDKFQDLDHALMAYNAGPTRLRRAIKDHELEYFRRYPDAVRRDYDRFRKRAGLHADWTLASRGGDPAGSK
jgi:soluble lytic murein transglycosylase